MGLIQRALTGQLQSAALLLVLTGTIPEPALAREGRQRAAFVSPSVVCRFGPLSSAEVKGVPPADGLDEEDCRRTGGGHGDGRWRRGADLRRPGLHEVGEPGHRCRVHESVLAQLDGCSLTGADLLLMAARLLSAPE